MLFGRPLRPEISRSGSASPDDRNADSRRDAWTTDFTRYGSRATAWSLMRHLAQRCSPTLSNYTLRGPSTPVRISGDLFVHSTSGLPSGRPERPAPHLATPQILLCPPSYAPAFCFAEQNDLTVPPRPARDGCERAWAVSRLFQAISAACEDEAVRELFQRAKRQGWH